MPIFFKTVPSLDEITLKKVEDRTFWLWDISIDDLPSKGPLVAELLLKTAEGKKLLALLIQAPIGYQLINPKIYRKIVKEAEKSNDLNLLHEVNKGLKQCVSAKHKALVLYPIIEQSLKNALSTNPDLYHKVVSKLKKIGLDELLMLNLFMQMKPNRDQVHELFKGGLFAVKDNGKLYSYIQANTASKSREFDCSHRSHDDARSFQGELFPEFLYGNRDADILNGKKTDHDSSDKPVEYTWFQTEYASLFGETTLESVLNWIGHKIAFIIYWWTGENVGPYGTSVFKESNPNLDFNNEEVPEEVTYDESRVARF